MDSWAPGSPPRSGRPPRGRAPGSRRAGSPRPPGPASAARAGSPAPGVPEIAADQLVHPVRRRSAEVGDRGRPGHRGRARPAGPPPRRRRPAGTGSPRHRDHRELRQRLHGGQGQVVELGGPQRGPGQSGRRHDQLRLALGREVAEHGPVDAADHRHPVGADHRDVDQVWSARPGRRRDEVAGQVAVALGVARAGARRSRPRVRRPRRPAPVARSPPRYLTPSAGRGSVRLRTRTRAPACLQPGDDQPAERAGAAGDEDGAHGSPIAVSVTSAGFRGSTSMTPGTEGM